MKYFVILLLCSTVIAAPNLNGATFGKLLQRKLSEGSKEILERLRELILNGNPDKEIPVLDPYERDMYHFEFKTQPLTLAIKANDIKLVGLGDFVVNNIDMPQSADKITFDGSLPTVLLTADKYDMKGLVFNSLPIYGSGKAYFEIGNFAFSGTCGVAEGANGVYLTDIHLVLSLETFKSETTGMLGGGDIDDLINALMADLAPEFFNNNSEYISTLISGLILDKINEIIEGLSLEDLINIVS